MNATLEKEANTLKAEFKQKITSETFKNDTLFNKFEKMRFEYFTLQNEHV